MNKNSPIYVAGHRGLVGSALVKGLQARGYTRLLTRTHQELDLISQSGVDAFFEREKPEFVFLAAAKVGGIHANNTYRAEFIYENLMVQSNVIHSAWKHGVKKLMFLGSSCIYPKLCPQPMKEEHLLTSALERTNEPYAIAKIAGLKMCESYQIQYGADFLAVMPTNLYGPEDNFDLETSHMLPAAIHKFHLGKLLQEGNEEGIVSDLGVKNFSEAEAILKKHGVSREAVTLWGTGKPRREFLYSEDMADACLFIMERETGDVLTGDPAHQFVNIGTGVDHTIAEIAEIVRKTTGYRGNIIYDSNKPDGTPRKLMSVDRLHQLGWKHRIPLETGIPMVYEAYLKKAPRR